MKRNFIILLIITIGCIYNKSLAQRFVFDETFDSNQNGWNEQVVRNKSCIIKEGVLELVNRSNESVNIAYCNAGFNPAIPFVFSMDILSNKIPNDNYFGFILDFKDEMNYVIFYFNKEDVIMERIKEDRTISKINHPIKLGREKEIKVRLEATGSNAKLYINNIPSMTLPYFSIESSGIGLILSGNQKASFDNIRIEQ